MDFDHSSQAKTLAQFQPEPVKPRERGMWGSVWDGIKAGAAETVGTVGAVARAYGAAQAVADEDNPMVTATVGRDAARRGAEQGREIIAAGDFDTEARRSFRNVATELRPNPLTATEAENMVFGLARGLTKVVGSTVALGPAGGAALFGASEADVTFQDLRGQGVDSMTAGKAAAVAGVIGAGAVALPIAGQTLRSTTALYVAGGPGGFVAQQALTAGILEQANYTDLAKKYDPLDPTGLALSALIPLPFAGYGAWRNVKAGRQAPAVPVEAVDAALAHNLTTHLDEIAVRQEPPQVLPQPEALPVQPAQQPPSTLLDLGPLTESFAQARQQMEAAGPDAARLLGGDLPPAVRNLVVGMQEAAADPRRMQALVRQLQSEARSGKNPVDATADAVDGMRALTEQQLAGLDVELKARPDEATRSVADRVQQLELNQPALRVSEEATAVQFMAAARREAAIGSDTELGALDADLLQVAADCALG